MAIVFQTGNFEGPLEVLLKLVEEEEVPITDVALAKVTDQYLAYLDLHPDIPQEELADFLLVAARLLLIKSRALLPIPPMDEGEDAESLVEQLRRYQVFAHAGAAIRGIIAARRFLFPREKSALPKGMFLPPRAISPERMEHVFREVIRALEPIRRLPSAVIERVVSIQEKIQEIRGMLASGGEMRFSIFLHTAQNPTDVVVAFLALLELVKQRAVCVSQETLFRDIMITTDTRIEQVLR